MSGVRECVWFPPAVRGDLGLLRENLTACVTALQRDRDDLDKALSVLRERLSLVEREMGLSHVVESPRVRGAEKSVDDSGACTASRGGEARRGRA